LLLHLASIRQEADYRPTRPGAIGVGCG
jgi:hypothetical protein